MKNKNFYLMICEPNDQALSNEVLSLLKGFTLVLLVFCSLRAVGGLLCHQFDPCCCI